MKASTPSASEWNKKNAMSESTVNSQRIGITLKLEAIKKKKLFSVQGQRRVLLYSTVHSKIKVQYS